MPGLKPRRSRPFRAERDFGLVVGGVFALLGGWWIYRERLTGWAEGLFAGGACLVALGLARPAWLAVPRRHWMRLGEAIGGVVAFVILAFVYFLVLTPIGLVKRLTGWDPLGRRAAPASSYWRPYSPRLRDPRHFEKMF